MNERGEKEGEREKDGIEGKKRERIEGITREKEGEGK